MTNQLVMATSLSLQSSDVQVGLLELYTSEGCSSCPPADRWLSSLKDDDRLWKELIPIAFHVDYWDYIGWKDRFADIAYSQRQREYARLSAVKTVYTPGFIYNGSEWRQWLLRRYFDFPKSKPSGILSVDVDDQIAVARYIPNNISTNKFVFNIALLGFDMFTNIKAGENNGRNLKHDFVVLAIKHMPLEFINDEYAVTTQLPTSIIKAPRYGIAAWISKKYDQRPLQAVGGWLPY